MADCPMFKRRHPLPFRQQIREAVWPSMGWRRAIDYWRHRVFRTGDSTYRITAGLGIGACVSFSPFLGTHVAQALFLSWLFRANLVSAFLGTAVGLPPFLPFLFRTSYKVGMSILSLFGFSSHFALTGPVRLSTLLHRPIHLLAPLTLGGYVSGITCGLLVYVVFYFPVRWARKIYLAQRMHRYRQKQGITP